MVFLFEENQFFFNLEIIGVANTSIITAVSSTLSVRVTFFTSLDNSEFIQNISFS